MIKKRRDALKDTVWQYYKEHGRHGLPWRKTTDPYRILVSEIMLQQTQVARVIPKYNAFLKVFPTVQMLAQAPLRDVLTLWQGLGYNRRAKYLHECAKEVQRTHNGTLPSDFETLRTLPGIGPYTAGALTVFAHNTPLVLIETNIRTVFIYHIFPHKNAVTDADILQEVTRTLDTKKPREWYWALMDYGAHLKASGVRNNTQSKHYTKQSTFKGSDREVRGAILRVLTKRTNATLETIQKETLCTKKALCAQLRNLQNEGLVKMKKEIWSV